MSVVNKYQFTITTIFHNGNWEEVVRPHLSEVHSYIHKYRRGYNNFFNMRRAIRVSIAADVVDDVDRDFFLQSGTDVLSLEIITSTYGDMTSIIEQLRKILRVYKRQNEYAVINITEFNITPKQAKYFATAGVSAHIAADVP